MRIDEAHAEPLVFEPDHYAGAQHKRVERSPEQWHLYAAQDA
jgi:hypothetical protein